MDQIQSYENPSVEEEKTKIIKIDDTPKYFKYCEICQKNFAGAVIKYKVDEMDYATVICSDCHTSYCDGDQMVDPMIAYYDIDNHFQ